MDLPKTPFTGLALGLAAALAGPAFSAPTPSYAPGPSQDSGRVITDRTDARPIEAPESEDGFLFAVFGDRTGGPAEGIKVLAEAVDEVNLIDPDLVMTVGDLINGYNTTLPWMAEMAEYRSTWPP